MMQSQRLSQEVASKIDGNLDFISRWVGVKCESVARQCIQALILTCLFKTVLLSWLEDHLTRLAGLYAPLLCLSLSPQGWDFTNAVSHPAFKSWFCLCSKHFINWVIYPGWKTSKITIEHCLMPGSGLYHLHVLIHLTLSMSYYWPVPRFGNWGTGRLEP